MARTPWASRRSAGPRLSFSVMSSEALAVSSLGLFSSGVGSAIATWATAVALPPCAAEEVMEICVESPAAKGPKVQSRALSLGPFVSVQAGSTGSKRNGPSPVKATARCACCTSAPAVFFTEIAQVAFAPTSTGLGETSTAAPRSAWRVSTTLSAKLSELLFSWPSLTVTVTLYVPTLVSSRDVPERRPVARSSLMPGGRPVAR